MSESQPTNAPAGETVTPTEDTKPAKKAAATKGGLHDAQARTVRMDDYPERSYKQAMTKEQREALEEAGLL